MIERKPSAFENAAICLALQYRDDVNRKEIKMQEYRIEKLEQSKATLEQIHRWIFLCLITMTAFALSAFLYAEVK